MPQENQTERSQDSAALTIEQLDAEWTLDSWSIGRTGTKNGLHHYDAYVHGFGACAQAGGKTVREAMDKAIAKFRADYPDELTAKRERLRKAREEAERLERELSEDAA